MLKDYMPNDGEYLFLSGNADAPVFLFIHGYGSAPQDLLPLALHTNSQGYNCAVLLLRGHGKDGSDLLGLTYADWLQQSIDFCSHYKSLYEKVYVIGFSMGATLSLHVAKEMGVDGVVAISTFLSPPALMRKILGLARAANLKYLPRVLQVTHNKTKNEIVYSRYLPVYETSKLIGDVSEIIPILENVHCPVLFFHSVDDKVSDYWSTAALAKSLSSCDACLVTFRCLKHFLHFDAPVSSFYQVISAFLQPRSRVVSSHDQDNLKEAWSHSSAELRHWSGILFQLIVGFFSIFGALVYFTLPDILNNRDGAPYYLSAYSILTSFFLILLALYFFYVNRVNVFLKHHIEPYLSSTAWTAYRTSNIFGGIESVKMTGRVTLAIVGIPLVISIGSVVYALAMYHERFFTFESQNIFLMALAIIAMILIVSAIGSLRILSKYTKRELYNIPVANEACATIQKAVQDLYLSVVPGIVTQADDMPNRKSD